MGRERLRLVVSTSIALGLHGAAVALLTRQVAALPWRPADADGIIIVPADIVAEPALPPSIPARPGQVIESPGTAKEEPPPTDTRRIAERNASTDFESRSQASSREPGRRWGPTGGAARAAASPRPLAVAANPAIGMTVSVPDAGAVVQTAADAGTSAAAALEPAATEPGLRVGLGEDPNDDLTDVPVGPETRLRANASSHAAFMNAIRDRVRRAWRVREVYQDADPKQRFGGVALVTEVAVRLAPDGSLTQATVQRSSGLAAVDEEATAALRRAAPFSPPTDVVDGRDGFSFRFSFTFDLGPLHFLAATRQALLDRWRPSPAFRKAGDHDRVTALRVLVRSDGSVAAIDPVTSAGIDFLDAGALDALELGDHLPVPPDSWKTAVEDPVPVWIEFWHRVAAPGDVRVLHRYQPTARN